ncbi:hypothetical protein N2152v2_007363 [Parachlorella kessleri]
MALRMDNLNPVFLVMCPLECKESLSIYQTPHLGPSCGGGRGPAQIQGQEATSALRRPPPPVLPHQQPQPLPQQQSPQQPDLAALRPPQLFRRAGRAKAVAPVLEAIQDPDTLKYEMRKMRNRQTAAKSRERRVQYMARLEDRLKELEQENQQLRSALSQKGAQLAAQPSGQLNKAAAGTAGPAGEACKPGRLQHSGQRVKEGKVESNQGTNSIKRSRKEDTPDPESVSSAKVAKLPDHGSHASHKTSGALKQPSLGFPSAPHPGTPNQTVGLAPGPNLQVQAPNGEGFGCLLSSTELDMLPLFTPSEVQAAASWAQQSSDARHARPAIAALNRAPTPHGPGAAPWLSMGMPPPLSLPATYIDNSGSSSLLAHHVPPVFPPPLPPYLGVNYPAAGLGNAASMLAMGPGAPFLPGGMGGYGLGPFPASPTCVVPGLGPSPPLFPWAPQDVSAQLLPQLQLPAASSPNGAGRPVITTGAE